MKFAAFCHSYLCRERTSWSRLAFSFLVTYQQGSFVRFPCGFCLLRRFHATAARLPATNCCQKQNSPSNTIYGKSRIRLLILHPIPCSSRLTTQCHCHATTARLPTTDCWQKHWQNSTPNTTPYSLLQPLDKHSDVPLLSMDKSWITSDGLVSQSSH